MNTLLSNLVELSDLYCAASGRTRSAISKRVFNDGKVIDRLAAGADLTTSRHQMALRWFSENWPAAAKWPKHIDRPRPIGDAA